VSTVVSKRVAKQISEQMLGQIIQMHDVQTKYEGKMTRWIIAFRTTDATGVPSELRCEINGPTIAFDRDRYQAAPRICAQAQLLMGTSPDLLLDQTTRTGFALNGKNNAVKNALSAYLRLRMLRM
jgi:hypothetical protein